LWANNSELSWNLELDAEDCIGFFCLDYVLYLTGKKGSTRQVNRSGRPPIKVISWGCGYPAVKHFRRAVFDFITVLGALNPFESDQVLVALCAKLQSRHQTVKARTYDPVSFLPEARRIIFNMP
jgi:hypothetical protein